MGPPTQNHGCLASGRLSSQWTPDQRKTIKLDPVHVAIATPDMPHEIVRVATANDNTLPAGLRTTSNEDSVTHPQLGRHSTSRRNRRRLGGNSRGARWR